MSINESFPFILRENGWSMMKTTKLFTFTVKDFENLYSIFLLLYKYILGIVLSVWVIHHIGVEVRIFLLPINGTYFWLLAALFLPLTTLNKV